MREKVDTFDWGGTALGPRESWPAELETNVQHVLDSGFPKALTWGESLTTIYNDAFQPILGNKPEALGRSFADIWSEAWSEIGPIADAAMEGRSTFIENFPLMIDRSGNPEKAYFTFCYSPLRLKDGTVAGMLDTVVETTQAVETQARLDLANRELAHRLKNSLAIVQSIASQTLRRHADEDAFASFEHRLEALSHAHEVLSQQNWTRGSLLQVVRDSVENGIDMDRVRIDGVDLAIGSKATMALSMILHELATNATKYGATSDEEGRVDISWTLDGGALDFRWMETGGPQVSPPQRTGFGTRLVERGLGPGSEGHLRYEPAGLDFRLRVQRVELER